MTYAYLSVNREKGSDRHHIRLHHLFVSHIMPKERMSLLLYYSLILCFFPNSNGMISVTLHNLVCGAWNQKCQIRNVFRGGDVDDGKWLLEWRETGGEIIIYLKQSLLSFDWIFFSLPFSHSYHIPSQTKLTISQSHSIQ